jgi:D-alanyl-D-alanine carboxypeptidase
MCRVRSHSRRAVWLFAAVAALAAAVLAGLAARTPDEPPPAARSGLQRVLDGLVAGRDRIAPGVTAYVSGPHGTWSGAAGLADVGTREPMRPAARLRLESVSKLWTATVILTLVSEGRLRLDDTVAHWLPGVLPYGDRITVRQLLNHTSGMVDSNDIEQVPALYLRRLHDRALRARVLRLSARLRRDPGLDVPPSLWVELAAALPLERPPGTAFHYSNIGYDVAGMIAERAGGHEPRRARATAHCGASRAAQCRLRPRLADHRPARPRLPRRR